MRANKLKIVQAKFTYDSFIDGIKMEQYDKIMKLASQLGYIETRYPYLFQLEGGDSYMAWDKESNKLEPVIYNDYIKTLS